MNHKDPNIDQLYQKGGKTQPPKSIDDAILAHAEQAHQSTRLGRLRPWLAVASVLFALPILWLMLEQPELQQSMQESLHPEPVPSISMSDEKPQPQAAAPAADPQDQEPTQGAITVTGSRVRAQKQDSSTAALEAPVFMNEVAAPATSANEQKSAAEDHKLESIKSVEAEADSNTEAVVMTAPTEPAAIRKVPFEAVPTVVTMVDLIKQIKPANLTEKKHRLWHELQQQLDKQQWQQAQQALEQLETAHPDIDFSDLSKHLEKLIIAE